MGNIVGLDLNIDKDYLAQAVKQTVLMGIAESLENKNGMTSQLVNTVLNLRVDSKGNTSRYDSDNKYTLLEYHVRTLLTDVVKEEIQLIAESRKDELRKMIRNELSKKANLEKFVDTFIKNTSEALDSSWKTNIDISFKKEREY